MKACHKTVQNSRPFATAPYQAGSDVLAPAVVVTTCLATTQDSQACRIAVHHRRYRKTGPCFAITVLRCSTHCRAFTLYPLGHTPYGRVALAPVAPDGELLCAAADTAATATAATTAADDTADTATAATTTTAATTATADTDGRDAAVPGRARHLAWMTTLFAAAIDADAGIAWPRTPSSDCWWDTQQVRLGQAASLFGLAAGLDVPAGEEIAYRLAIPRLTLIDATRRYAQAHGYQERGAIIVALVDRLMPGRCLIDQLLHCGAVAGMWGDVHRWRSGSTSGTAYREVFHGSSTLEQRRADTLVGRMTINEFSFVTVDAPAR